MTSTLSTPTTHGRNIALTATRVVAGLLGAMQVAGMTYFLVIDRSASVWLGPLIDVPVIVALLVVVLLKLGVAVWPGLTADRRIRMGLVAAAIGVVVTLFKIPLYDEPEGVTILAFDAVLLALLLLARRGAR